MTTTMTDLEFLRSVCDELDRGWIQGQMCNDYGKCLLGAGAAVMGVVYVNGQVKDRTMYELEAEAGRRLWHLLKDDFIQEIDDSERNAEGVVWLEDDIEFYNSFPGDGIVEFNDSVVQDYSTLRNILTAKIEELESVGASVNS